MSRSIHI
jgi:uncharacterized protein with GYD domain